LKLCILLASDAATVLAGVASVRTASFILKLRASVAQINDEAPLLAPTEGIGVGAPPSLESFAMEASLKSSGDARVSTGIVRRSVWGIPLTH